MSDRLAQAEQDAGEYAHAANLLEESLHKLQAAVLKIREAWNCFNDGELSRRRVDDAITEAEQC